MLNEFSSVKWMSQRHGTHLRSYHADNGVLICVSDYLKIHISQCANVVIVDTEECYLDLAALFLINLGLGVCSLLRGWLPLHGCGVEINGLRAGIMGPSGVGKSTLLWALIAGGAKFCNDDLIPIQLKTDSVTAIPSKSSYPKVSRNTLNMFGMDPSCLGLRETYPGEDEFWMSVNGLQRAIDIKELSALFVLDLHAWRGSPAEVVIKHQSPVSAIPLLVENTHASWAVYPLLDPRCLFRTYANIVRQVPIYTLCYPKVFNMLPRVATAIQDTLNHNASRDLVDLTFSP